MQAVSRPSIERAVVRAYLASIVGVAATIALVSAVATTLLVIHREDVQALAQADIVIAELANHQNDSDTELVARIEHEVDEQRSFGRDITVWRESVRLVGTAPFDEARVGCHVERDHRVCMVKSGRFTVRVAAALMPVVWAQLSTIALILGAAALAVLLFALRTGRVVKRSLEPLERFEARLAALPALDSQRIDEQWGAEEIEHLATTFNALLTRIQAAVAREHRFVANAAHELRTPLTHLHGQLELALADGTGREETTDRVRRALQACGDLNRSTEALLALARDRVALNDTVELADLVTDVMSVFEGPSLARLELAGLQGLVRGDETLLRLVVRNLVENALAYTSGTVRVEVEQTERESVLRVLDEGPGLSADDLLRVREPFVRGAGSRGTRGTGLGLALVEHLVALHGASFTLNNRVPTGLVAELRFPRK